MRMIAGSLRIEARSRTTSGRVLELLTASICCALLASCGGGGGGGGGANRAPVFGTLSFSTNEDTDLSGTLTGTDADGDTVTFQKTGDPLSGTVTSFAASGAFVYRPNGNQSGNDSFTVRMTDSRGVSVNGTVAIAVAAVNDTPVAANDVMRADGAAQTNLNVRGNDSDQEGGALTVAIEEPAVIGTVAVNADGTVRVTGLPANFKGVTRFKYRVTDPGGAFAVATSAIFVGTEPFRYAFIGDEAANGSPEIFMTDFVATFRVSSATEGNMRLRGFAISANGSTIAYRREDSTAPANTDFSYARTQTPGTQVRVSLPSGYKLAQDAQGNDQFAVSPDGSWIAVVASQASPTSKSELFLLNVSDPATIRSVAPGPTAVFASLPRFSQDQPTTYLYFLASDDNSGSTKKALYRVALSAGSSSSLVSNAPAVATDDISNYFVSPDQTRIVLVANRGNAVGLYSVNPAQASSERQLSHTMALLESVQTNTVAVSPDVSRVAYTTLNTVTGQFMYVAEVAATPNDRTIGPLGARAASFDADGSSLLYSKALTPTVDQVFEAAIDSGAQDALVGNGEFGVYDSSSDTVILRQQLISGGTFYKSLAAAYRGSFGTTAQPMNTSGAAARYIDLSGADRAVAVVGEGPPTGSASTARFALINARAPGSLVYLATFPSPLSGITSSSARLVTY